MPRKVAFLNFQGKCTLEVLREYYFCFVFSRRAKLDPEAAEASEWTIVLLASFCLLKGHIVPTQQ